MLATSLAVVLAVALVVREVMARRRERQLREEIATLETQLKAHDTLANVGQLVSGFAQDLKSPLQGVLGSAELLAASDSTGADAAQGLQEIRDNVTRAVGIVRNLLAFTETTALDRRWHDLNEVVRGAIQQKRTGAGTLDRMKFQGTTRLQLVYVDGRQLERVLVTLLDHTAAGDVAVTTKRVTSPEDHMVIDIDDPAGSVNDDAVWSGDLAACRRVLEAHGGLLDIVPQPGGGVRFHLELPVTSLVEKPQS